MNRDRWGKLYGYDYDIFNVLESLQRRKNNSDEEIIDAVKKIKSVTDQYNIPLYQIVNLLSRYM